MPVPPHGTGRDGPHSLRELLALEDGGAVEITQQLANGFGADAGQLADAGW